MANGDLEVVDEVTSAYQECGLTTKQHRYVQSRLSGFCPTDAYKRAYCASNMNPNTIYKEAHKLERHPKVAPRLARYQQAMFDAQIHADVQQVALTKHEIINGLRLNASLARDRGDFSASNRALELLGKIYATTGFTDDPNAAAQYPELAEEETTSCFDEFLRDALKGFEKKQQTNLSSD